MSTIRQTFSQSLRPLFIPFIMAGHPSLEATVAALIALSRAGADIIELGLPFSDPTADGPINQEAAKIGLEQGAHLSRCFEVIQTAQDRGCNTPIILFSYFNPILNMGLEVFTERAVHTGLSGVLIVDLPPEEGEDFYRLLSKRGIAPILFTSPTTDPLRLPLIQSLNPGFIYYIARLGVTGLHANVAHNLQAQVTALKNYIGTIPIAVGFGISSPESARKVAECAEGVIVGSLFVQTLATEGLAAFEALAKQLAEAVHGESMKKINFL